MQQDQVGQNLNDFVIAPASLKYARQTFPHALVQYVKKSDLSSIHGAILYEIITLYMILIRRPQPDTAPIRQPKGSASPAAFAVASALPQAKYATCACGPQHSPHYEAVPLSFDNRHARIWSLIR